MKIIISPSKTKKAGNIGKVSGTERILFTERTEEIVRKIAKMKATEIEKKFKIKREQAEKLSAFYNDFENQEYGQAIATYTGIAYKSMGISDLSKKDLEFMQENLRILSALYGILTPFTELKEYRLDMVNRIFEEISLYEFWKNDINSYFKKEEFIINLASKEYSKMVPSENMYSFEFYDEIEGKLRQISTNSKKMRGFAVNYIVRNRIEKAELLKEVELDGYSYSGGLSTERNYVYVRG